MSLKGALAMMLAFLLTAATCSAAICDLRCAGAAQQPGHAACTRGHTPHCGHAGMHGDQASVVSLHCAHTLCKQPLEASAVQKSAQSQLLERSVVLTAFAISTPPAQLIGKAPPPLLFDSPGSALVALRI